MSDQTKRELRQEKREIKRLGVQRVRRQLKRALAENPDEAAEVVVDFGRLRTAPLNGNDQDATRKRAGRPDDGR